MRIVDKFGRYDGNNLILDMRGVSHLAVLVEYNVNVFWDFVCTKIYIIIP